MLRFCGYQLELTVDAILAGRDGPSLCTARDALGRPWLIAQVAYEPSYLAWLCVPTSERATRALLDNSADPRDLVRHSLTGMVELVAVVEGQAVPEQCLLCSRLPHKLLDSVALPSGGSLRLEGEETSRAGHHLATERSSERLCVCSR